MRSVFTILYLSFLGLLWTVASVSAQNSWRKAGDMPGPRGGQTTNEINGKIYFVGGTSNEGVPLPDSGWVYDRETGIWSSFPQNGPRFFHTSCVVHEKLYIIGGSTNQVSSTSSMIMYDPQINEWSKMKDMPTHRGILAAVAIDEKIYVLGGNQNFSFSGLKTMEMYNTLDSTWTELESMPAGRWGLSAVAFRNKIYVFGGRSLSNSSVYSRVDIYDPETDNWTSATNDMPTPRYEFTACLLVDSIYTIGGWYHSGLGPIYDKVEVFDPVSETWTTKPPIPVKLALLSSLGYRNTIYTYGGSYTTHMIRVLWMQLMTT